MVITPAHGTALVTGASSGIGEAFARYFASQGNDVILVARREERLTRIAGDLEAAYGINAEVFKADLSNPKDISHLAKYISQLSELDFLVNSAGFAFLGLFADIPMQEFTDMIHCHNLSVVSFCHAALPGMIAKRKGVIINVSSIGAFTPKRGDAVYCATKAFINLFSETLHHELKGTGIHVQALCPGFIITGFHDTPAYAALQVKKRIPRYFWNTPEQLVAKSIKALEQDKVIYIPYFKNKLITTLSRLGFIELLVGILSSFFHHTQEEGIR